MIVAPAKAGAQELSMVEFELVDGQQPPRSRILDHLEKLFLSGGRPLQIWQSRPPYALAIGILAAVALELTLARRLYFNLGAGAALVSHFISVLIALFVMEAVVAEMAHYVAGFFDKTGNRLHLFALLNTGLVPLFIFLPASFIFWAAGGSPTMRLLVFLLLLTKVLYNWKEAIKATHKLTKAQLAAVTVATLSLLVLVPYLVFLFSFIGILGSM